MEEKVATHTEKLQELGKRFKLLKFKTVLFWILYNAAVDITAYLVLHGSNIEIMVCVMVISTIISTMVMINSLNKWDKLKAEQEAQLLEKAPLSRLKF